MLNAIASSLRALRRYRRQPVAVTLTAPATLVADCGESPPGLVWADIVTRDQAANLAPGSIYIESGRVRRVPRPAAGVMDPDPFAESLERWLADMAPDVSTTWDRDTFSGLVEWFAAENDVAPVSIDNLLATSRFTEDAAGKFAAAPLVADDEAEEPLSPTAKRMLPLLATAGTLNVKAISEALGCDPAPVSRAISRSLRRHVVAVRVGREVFVSLRDTAAAARRLAG